MEKNECEGSNRRRQRVNRARPKLSNFFRVWYPDPTMRGTPTGITGQDGSYLTEFLLAAQSHVGVSFVNPDYTGRIL